MNFISHGGGALLYVIVGVSVLAFALFFERALYLFLRLKLNMDKAFKKVTYHLH